MQTAKSDDRWLQRPEEAREAAPGDRPEGAGPEGAGPESTGPESTGPETGPESGNAVSCARTDTAEAHRRAVERAVEAMRRRLDEELSLQKLAEVGIMSPYHFSRVFHHNTGLPPGRFLSALRVQAAKRLLLTTDASVTEVCFEVGYNSLGTFSRRFTELVGISPRGFRRLARRGARSAVSFLRSQPSFTRFPGGSGVTGTVDAPEGFSGPIFVGLFPTPVPEGRPVACSILTAPGHFRLGPVADGTYHLLAAGLGWTLDVREYLLYDQALRSGPPGGLVIDGGEVHGETELALGPPDDLHPPILMAIPLLLNERFRPAAAPTGAVAGEEGRAG